MSTEEIQEVKTRIASIDRQMVELQAECFTASMRLSVLLAQNAKANTPVETQNRMNTSEGFDETL